MFFGECLCFAVFHLIYFITVRRQRSSSQAEAIAGKFNANALVTGNQNFSPFIFLPAALCDMVGTSLAYIGLNLTYASSFQMLRGAVMIFTGLLSVAFLGRELQRYKWFGMFTVVAGLAIIGVTDFVFSDKDASTDTNGIIAGDLLIVLAQIVTALQMVYEEKFVTKYNVPALQAVGLEGIFGFIILGILLIPMYFIHIPAMSKDDPYHRLENALDAFHQMFDNPIILIATLGNVLSIAFFNFAGISVTKEMSATTRMVLDSLRTIVIWVVSLSLKWQKFQPLHLLGFAFLISGMLIYNNILFLPMIKRIRQARNGAFSENETDPLLRNQQATINT
jgi:drug/metabolite transporter (DMT)-like permease